MDKKKKSKSKIKTKKPKDAIQKVKKIESKLQSLTKLLKEQSKAPVINISTTQPRQYSGYHRQYYPRGYARRYGEVDRSMYSNLYKPSQTAGSLREEIKLSKPKKYKLDDFNFGEEEKNYIEQMKHAIKEKKKAVDLSEKDAFGTNLSNYENELGEISKNIREKYNPAQSNALINYLAKETDINLKGENLYY